MKSSLALAVLLGCFLASFSLPAATYHVAKTGSDTAPGTAEQPFLTVQKAVNTANAGDTVLVGAGTYAENVRTADKSGSNGAPIIYDGQGVATVGSWSLEKPYLHIQNFTIAGGTNYWGGQLYVARTGDNCIVSNNVFNPAFNRYLNPLVRWSGPDVAPFGDAGSGNLFVHNTITNSMNEVVFRVYGDTNLFYGNRMLDCDATDFMHIFGLSNSVVANVISNLFDSGTYNNHVDFIQTFSPAGFGSRGHVIESNYIVGMHGLAQLAMLADSTVGLASNYNNTAHMRDITFRNNIFVGVSAKASMAMGGVSWYNNLFYHCATNTANGGPVLIYASLPGAHGQGHSGRVFNNVFVDCGIAGATNTGGYQFDTVLTNVAADYNFISKNGRAIRADPSERAVGAVGGWDANWWEDNGINGGNPMFANVSQLDFRLAAGSPLLGAALPLNELFPTDMRGNIRGAQWDIGPLEFNGDEQSRRPDKPTELRVVLK